MSRRYDVILYGAAGFTGRQAVAYLARHVDARRIRWAIAGPDGDALKAVRGQVGAGGEAADILVADSRDQRSVDAVVSRARVVASTAGPFARYGTPVVDACVRFATHHANIAGETWWVRDVIARYHGRAAAQGTRIVPFCGFDSVPSDLGASLLARGVREVLGVPCDEVRAYFQLYGGFNGGTFASRLVEIEAGLPAPDPFLLNPGPPSPRQLARSRDPAAPRFDTEIGAWVGPFFMAPTNTRVVRRSAALSAEWGEPYGRDFAYREYLRYDPPLAAAKAAAVTGGIALFDALLRWAPTRRLLAPRLARPGTGPSPDVMERGWYSCDLLGLAEDGRSVRGRIHGRGDPSNRGTVAFLCESALALALDADALPGGPRRGGVLTPATAIGDVLVERLRRAGVTIEVAAPAYPAAAAPPRSFDEAPAAFSTAGGASTGRRH